MKRIITLLGFIWMSLQPGYTQDSLLSRIVLLGDAGQLTNGKQPVINAVKKTVPLDKKTVVIFLGDNIYKIGLPDDQVINYGIAKSVLDSQVSIVENTAARLYMIPGNHDWNNGGEHGYQSVVREQYYVDLLGKNNVKFYPEGGCPGPVEVKIDTATVLVILDTQWWIHPFDKPGVESDCPYKTRSEVIAQLENILAKNFDKLVIFATHHPFRTYGVHGGYFTWKQHIFPLTELNKDYYLPLPIVGSIYPISRGIFGSPQDLPHPEYTNMVNVFEKVLRTHPNVIYVAGHEHALQLIRDSALYVVSGSASKTNRVSKNKKRTLYASPETGFAVLEISKNKNVRVSFTTVTDSIRKEYSENIMNFTRVPLKDSATPTVVKPTAKFKDTVNAPASLKYGGHGGLRNLLLGENYRKEWSQNVNLKVFHINEEKGGFEILELGGGKQTKSLKLKDKKGVEWTLRTIDKDPEKAIPEAVRNSVAEDIVQDMISASHPYSALAVPDLAKASGITVPRPEFFFVPDDPAFGMYQRMFANTVCLLELREPTRDGTEAKTTGKLIEKLLNENDHIVDQKEYLNARMLDFLVADWDRHFDQWRWGSIDTGKGKIYYPIPRDRDQAFFYSDGLFMSYITQSRMPFLKGFRYKIPRVNWFGFGARDVDRAFLSELSENEWETIITKFQKDITDSVINTAVNKMPLEINPIRNDVIIGKLKSRRDLLLKKGMRYYRFVNHYVNVRGSNMPEYFRVSNTDTGLQVTVYARNAKTDTGFKIYQRTFDHKVTHEIRMYGLNGNDIFYVDSTVKSRIKLKIVGGKGNDTFNLKGNVRSFIYDIKDSGNYFLSKNKAKLNISNDPMVNDFNWIEYKYPIQRFPRVLLGYNADDGILVGLGIARRTFGFRKEPFATDNRLGIFFAPQRGAYSIRYKGEFNEILGKNDLVLIADLLNPALHNFFGLGNNTEIDESKDPIFYLARYKYFTIEALARKRFGQKISISAGPMFYRYWIEAEDNVGKILENPSDAHIDSLSVYSQKTFLGGRIVADINTLNDELFPTRGVQWTNDLSAQYGVSENTGKLIRFSSDLVVYSSLRAPAKVVSVIRLGYGHIFNKDYEYFQSLNLGANNFLRGFRKNRFSGNTLAYGSFELRVKLFESKWYVLPGQFGLVGFNDVGRVWLRGEDSKRWHYAYGGGFYYVPFNLLIVSATMGFSKEESLLNFSVGTKLNITF